MENNFGKKCLEYPCIMQISDPRSHLTKNRVRCEALILRYTNLFTIEYGNVCVNMGDNGKEILKV